MEILWETFKTNKSRTLNALLLHGYLQLEIMFVYLHQIKETDMRKLEIGTRVVFENKWGENQKGIFMGLDNDPTTDGKWGVFKCRPFGDDMEIDCLYPLNDSQITVLTEEEFQNRPWVEEV